MYKKSESNISVCCAINRADIRRRCHWYTIPVFIFHVLPWEKSQQRLFTATSIPFLQLVQKSARAFRLYSWRFDVSPQPLVFLRVRPGSGRNVKGCSQWALHQLFCESQQNFKGSREKITCNSLENCFPTKTFAGKSSALSLRPSLFSYIPLPPIPTHLYDLIHSSWLATNGEYVRTQFYT